MGTIQVAAFDNRSEAEIRAALIATARTLVKREGRVSLNQLYAESGIDHTGFYRCFSNKAALLAAIVQGDVQALQDIAQVAKPQIVQSVAQVGGAPIPVTPPVDPWLERRLRVFERALSTLEGRQEKSEQDLVRHVALLEEKLAAAQFATAPPSRYGNAARVQGADTRRLGAGAGRNRNPCR